MRRFLLGCILIACMVLPSVQLGHAQDDSDDNEYDGLDVLFLVDQSGSMGGAEYETEGDDPEPKDPLRLRFSGVQFGVDWLGNFRAQQALLDNDLDIGVSVVNFGGVSNSIRTSEDTRERALDWTPLTPNTLADWQSQRETLVEQLSAETFGLRNLGNTNFVAAFNDAFELFSERTSSDDNRLQAIILLTDGEPCAPSLFSNRDCLFEGDKQEHMRELADNVRAQFGDDNQRVFAVAINTDGNIDEQYLDDWEDISNGNLYELESSTDVGVTFNRILTGLGSDVLGDLDDTVTVLDDITFSARTTGQPLLSPSQAAKDVVMPPYQQLASFSLFKTNSDSQLILTNPSGDMLTDDDAFVTGEATPIEVWRVPNPEPGVWTLTTRRRVDGEEVADSGATISTELLRSSFSLERPEETPQMYLPVTSTVAFRDVAGDLLDAYPSDAYSLEGDLVITPPSGAVDEQRVSLAPDDDRPDKAVFVADFTPTQAGTYTLEVQASAEGEDGNTLQFSQELDLAVRDTLFEIEMNNDELLEQEDSVDVLEGVSRTYSLRFVDSSLNEISGIQVDQFEVATADDAESCADAQPLEDEAEDDPFFVRTAHTEPGDLALCLRIAVADTTRPGQTITVYDAAYATLDVEAVEALSMVLTEPVQQSSGDEVVVSLTNRSFQSDFRWEVLHSELPLWFPMRRPHWQPDAVDVAVQVVNEGGDSVDLESTIQQNTSVQPSDFITLSVRNSVDTNNPTSVTLSPEGFDGDTWRGQINGLESGEYEFEFNAMQDPIGNTNRAFLPTASTIGYRVDVSGNPWVSAAEWGLVGLQVLAWAGVISGAAYIVTNRIQHLLAVNSNPLEGELGIVVRKDERPYLVRDPQERPYILPLGEKKQIEKEFDLDQIPLVRPPLTYLRVEAMNGRQHRRQIRVFYSMDGTHTPFMRLEKGEPQRVWQDSDGNDYYLTWDDDMSKHDTGS